jgi:hypothetical protein
MQKCIVSIVSSSVSHFYVQSTLTPGENRSVNSWIPMENSMENSMEFHGIFHGKFSWKNPSNVYEKFDGIPWKIPWNSISFPWNSVNSWNFMEFGFDRDIIRETHSEVWLIEKWDWNYSPSRYHLLCRLMDISSNRHDTSSSAFYRCDTDVCVCVCVCVCMCVCMCVCVCVLCVCACVCECVRENVYSRSIHNKEKWF